MIVHNMEQGTPEWFDVRRGIPTGSCFSKIYTSQSKPSSSSNTYMNELLAEWKLGDNVEEYQNEHMMRGTELEPDARSLYEFVKEVSVEQVGFCTNEEGTIGVSPDGFVGDEGLLEIKCPKASTHISYLLSGKLPANYKPQVQGQMLITERQWCDFVSYYPGLEPFIIRVEKDQDYCAGLQAELDKFVIKMMANREKLRSKQ